MAVFYGFGGFLFGFLVPLGAGLVSCVENDLMLADFWLRVFFFWLVLNQLCAPLFMPLFMKVSPSFWSLVYTVFPLTLMVPKSNLLKTMDDCTVSVLNLDTFNMVKPKLEELCVLSRRALNKLYSKLKEVTSF